MTDVETPVAAIQVAPVERHSITRRRPRRPRWSTKCLPCGYTWGSSDEGLAWAVARQHRDDVHAGRGSILGRVKVGAS